MKVTTAGEFWSWISVCAIADRLLLPGSAGASTLRHPLTRRGEHRLQVRLGQPGYHGAGVWPLPAAELGQEVLPFGRDPGRQALTGLRPSPTRRAGGWLG